MASYRLTSENETKSGLLRSVFVMPSCRALISLRRATGTRVCALWLIVFAIVPFTAPFAALHWSDLVGGSHPQKLVATVGAPVASNAQEDDADDAASDACIQRTQTCRFGELAPITSPTAGDSLTSTPAILLVRTPTAPGASALVTILRL